MPHSDAWQKTHTGPRGGRGNVARIRNSSMTNRMTQRQRRADELLAPMRRANGRSLRFEGAKIAPKGKVTVLRQFCAQTAIRRFASVPKPRAWLFLFLLALILGLPTYVFAADPEFGGYCAEGLVNRHRIKTDCKINWTSKEGKLYCFANSDSMAEFLKGTEH